MAVPHYEEREVEIFFPIWWRRPKVTVDGPTESPHRYRPDGHLCMWHPDDPDEERWVFDDGLLNLLGHIQAHLFKEAWWREKGEWLGLQCEHGPKRVVEEDDPV